MHTSSRLLLSFALLTAVAGCGSSPVATIDAGTDATAGDTGTADAAMIADTGTDTGGSLDDAGADAASTDDAASAATVTISGLTLFGNCMPIVAPDPIRASWTATVAGATGATATLTSATLVITGTTTIVQNLTVDVPVIALTGGAGSSMQTKVLADMNPSMACGGTCGSPAHLDLTFMIDGAPVMATADATYECAF